MRLCLASLIFLAWLPPAAAQVDSSSTATRAAAVAPAPPPPPPKPKRKKKAVPPPPPAPMPVPEVIRDLPVDAVTPRPGGDVLLRAPRPDPEPSPPPPVAPRQVAPVTPVDPSPAKSKSEDAGTPEEPDGWMLFESPRLEKLRSLRGTGPLIALLVLLLVAAALSSMLRRQFDELSILSRLAGAANKVLRILVGALLLFLVVAWLPADALPFALLAAALAIGWSTRDVLPDLIAGVVIAFERRVKPGLWLAGEGFAGVVERVGLRATWLRDDTNRRIAVPNRALVSTPLTSEEGRWPTRDVTIRVVTDLPAETVRRAIVDAVLMSPFTPVADPPSVRRDGSDPIAWHVRARVLDLSFAPRFEGELLERAEAILQYERRTAADASLNPS